MGPLPSASQLSSEALEQTRLAGGNKKIMFKFLTKIFMADTEKVKSITIDGIEYVPRFDFQPAETYKNLKYCIVRTYSAGVFAGYVEQRKGKEGVIRKARRLWKWSGAASLSQLAVDGVANPSDCKFPCEVDSIELTGIIEVIPCTKKAQESINNTPIWQI